MNNTPKLNLSEPVVVAVSAPNETRWGFTQFPAFSPLPDGSILLIYADAEDASETHGEPAPSFVSRDEGQTWGPLESDLVPARPHFSVTPAYDGEYLVIPSLRYFDVKKEAVELPEPVAESFVYGPLYTYRVSDFPSKVFDYFSHLDARRWRPSTGKWEDEKVAYDTENLLAWRRKDSDLLPRAFLERPALQHKGELLYADYRVRYAMTDGHIPAKGGTDLMASDDNGHSFKHRATIAVDRSGNDLYGEPALEETADGGLICVLRKADHEQKPMVMNFSSDAGRTWSEPEILAEFGVFPFLIRLPSGPLIVSYGRPGVWIKINMDGLGRDWSDPICIIEGDHNEVGLHTCGYTGMHVLGPRSFLLTYSDFDHVDAEGVPRKAVLSRRIELPE